MVPDSRIAVTLLPWALAAWLVAEACWDTCKEQDIPRWFSTIPILAGVLYSCSQGYVWLGVGFLLSVAFTNLSMGFARLLLVTPTIILAESLYRPYGLPLVFGWMLAWFAWETGVLGGADALAVGYSLLWFPQSAMFYALLLGMAGWSAAWLWKKYGRGISLRLWTTVANRTGGTTVPGLGGIAAGALAFAAAKTLRLV